MSDLIDTDAVNDILDSGQGSAARGGTAAPGRAARINVDLGGSGTDHARKAQTAPRSAQVSGSAQSFRQYQPPQTSPVTASMAM